MFQQSTLHQLLFPLLGSHLDQLDDVQRTALRSALGLHEGAAPDWMTLSHAARPARPRPVVPQLFAKLPGRRLSRVP